MISLAVLPIFMAAVGLSTAQTIDPNSVSSSLRATWCQSQTTQCPLICLQTIANTAATTSNTCDPATLDWSCVCAGGTTPSIANYSLTIPFFECQEWGNQCVTGCGQNNDCSSNCRQQHPCGAQNPTRVNTTSSTSSTASRTASGSSTASATDDTAGYSGFGSSGSTPSATAGAASGNSNSNTSAATVLNLAQSYSFAVVFAGFFAGFALLL
ncbi:hypothetical protein LTS18_011534 [Coniosporium uncinatum]|uniref:Uncharacterized protein n=1 Tax=Coniosporium uncinatum TaxID=93489 RepID=A0ACC3DCB1_9PEZI|nr:hypothetical protein LTS18_011534 [Coniosporium uncinatum]